MRPLGRPHHALHAWHDDHSLAVAPGRFPHPHAELVGAEDEGNGQSQGLQEHLGPVAALVARAARHLAGRITAAELTDNACEGHPSPMLLVRLWRNCTVGSGG
jgi:hypothetical protein